MATLVQKKMGQLPAGGNGASGTLTLDTPTQAGNTLIVIIFANYWVNATYPHGVYASFEPSDNIESEYELIGSVFDPNAATSGAKYNEGYAFIASDIEGGSATIEVVASTPNGGVGGGWFFISEWSGVDTSVPIAVSVFATVDSSTDPGVSLQTTTANQTVILAGQIIAHTWGSPSGFTKVIGINSTAIYGSGIDQEIYFQNVVTPGTVTYSLPSGTSAYKLLIGIVLTDNVFTGPYLDTVVTDLCQRAGLIVSGPGTQIDVSQITTIPIKGYMLSSQADAKTALMNPMAAYFVDCCESDNKLVFVPRGANASVMTIPGSDLGLENDKCELVETIMQQQELPREVDILFIDPALDWQQNKMQKQRSSRVVKTLQVTTLSLPMVLTPTEARAIAEKSLYLSYLEARPYAMSLWKMIYSVIDPTDIIQFVYQGLTFQMRATSAALGAGFTVALAGVSETQTAYTSVVVGGGNTGVPIQTVKPSAQTTTFLLDVPYLEDTDAVADRSYTGFYFGMTSPLASWPGGVLNKSIDDITFDGIASAGGSLRMQTGTTTGILGPPPILWTWDMTNSLNITMNTGSLAGDTDLNVLNGTNSLIVGSESGGWEVIQFADCTQQADGSYTISRLLRGRRNTEFNAYSHAAGDTVLVPLTGLQHEDSPLSLIGMERYYRGVTIGQSITSVPDTDMTLVGNDLKPASPVHITATRDGGNNITFGWVRRTRYAGDWLENTGSVPLNEDVEAYSIDVIKSDVVVRTLVWVLGVYDGNGNPTALYPAVNQTEDGLTPGSPVTVVVYQISGEVGRGQPGSATV
jgi:hypothetical protein